MTNRAPVGSRGIQRQLAAELGDDVAADDQAQAQPPGLGGGERREQGLGRLRRQARAVVGDGDPDLRAAGRDLDGDLRIGPALQGLQGVLQQIDQHLLQPEPLGHDQGFLVGLAADDTDAGLAQARPDQQQGAVDRFAHGDRRGRRAGLAGEGAQFVGDQADAVGQARDQARLLRAVSGSARSRKIEALSA
jgi:hypothetical protein